MTILPPSGDLIAPTATRARPLRICSILTSLTSGGAEILVTNLNSAFAQRGAQASVALLCEAGTLGNSQGMEEELAGKIEGAGAKVHNLGLTARRGLLEGVRALRRHLRETRPDIVHAHTVRAVLMLAFCGFSGPIVFTHHNSRLSFPPRAFRLLDHVVAHYVAISSATAAHYRNLSRRPFTLIPNAPAASYRTDGPRTAIGSPCRVLSIGTISEQKNYDLLIEIARILHEQRSGQDPAFVFQVAGGGKDLERLRQKVTNLGLEDVIFFLGERSDIHELLASSDLYLNTSLHEGFSIAILEAMAMGLPIIASDVAGNRGLVTTGQNGSLCPIEKPASFANALNRLAKNPTCYRKYSAGALDTSQNFTLESAAKRHFELYHSLLHASRLKAR